MDYEQHLHMSFEDYLKHPACSPSLLKSYAVNPVLCRFSSKRTKAKDEGTAFHAVMDGSFTKLYLRGPEGPCNKNPWLSEKKKLQEENPEKIVLSASEYDSYLEMSDAVYLNRQVGPLLQGIVERESTYIWKDVHGVPCKARPDAVTKEGLILDFKSAASVGANWWRDAHKYHYDLSVAHYLDDDLPFTGYVFIVVSKEPPYFVMKWQMHPDALMGAYKRVRELRDAWHESYQRNSFENVYDQEYFIPARFQQEEA